MILSQGIKMSLCNSFFTVTSKVLENCLVSYVECQSLQDVDNPNHPVVDDALHKLGKVIFHESEEDAKTYLKRHFLEVTEVDLLAKIYAVESDKLESQRIRFELRFIDKKDPSNKMEISKLNLILNGKRANSLKMRKEIKKLRSYRNKKIEIKIPPLNRS